MVGRSNGVVIKEEGMPKYLLQGSYTAEGAKGLEELDQAAKKSVNYTPPGR